MVNPIKSFRESLRQVPSEYRRWLSLGILVALLVALPLTLWGFMNSNFEIRKRAATGEPTPVPTASPLPDCQRSGHTLSYDLARTIDEVYLKVTGDARQTLSPGTNIKLEGWEFEMTTTTVLYPRYGGSLVGISPAITYSPNNRISAGTPILICTLPTPTPIITPSPVVSPSAVPTLVPSAWPSPVPTFLPSPSPGAYGLNLELKFVGVTSRPSDDSDKIVQIYATSNDGGPDLASEADRLLVIVKVDDSGTYSAEIGLPADYFDHRYRLRVKGPKHLQAVFPDVLFQVGEKLDLTGQPLKPGDLNQDGQVDSLDLQLIDERMFSTDPADVAVADINFDQIVDIIDRTLVLNTLSIYYDPD